MKNYKKHAFTLIELLVVIAIIAILAAILFPVFARARENARRSSCSSNLKQIGLGIIQYQQDYDERFPPRHFGGETDGISWRVITQPYLKSAQVFACPSNTGNTLPTTYNPTNTIIPISYACNGAGNANAAVGVIDNGYRTNIGGNSPMTDLTGEAIASVASASQVVLVTEADGVWAYPEINMAGSSADVANRSFKGHLGQVNFLFCDGHVKSLKPTATGTPVNMWTIEDDGAGPATLTDRLNAWQDKVNKG